MPGIENPGIQALDVWRKLADFTPAIASIIDDGAAPRTLHNITGRGTWISAGAILDDDETCTLGYNIDGAGVVTVQIGPMGTGDGLLSQNMPLFIGFETSLVVTMVLGAPGNGWFWSVAVVE
jgi:hypothetical protein